MEELKAKRVRVTGTSRKEFKVWDSLEELKVTYVYVSRLLKLHVLNKNIFSVFYHRSPCRVSFGA